MISAYWMGEPAPGATLTDPELGKVFPQSEELTLHAGPARLILGSNLANAPLDQVTEPMPNLNIASGRWASENNLVDCGFLDDSLAKRSAAPQSMQGKLIGE